MPATKAENVILAAVSVAAGGTQAAPVAAGVGATVDTSTDYDMVVSYKFTNGAAGPGVQISITVYGSNDGTRWYEIYSISSKTIAANGVDSGSIQCPRSYSKIRADVWGNSVQPVTAEVYLQRMTGV
jgi:hypothetical protein